MGRQAMLGWRHRMGTPTAVGGADARAPGEGRAASQQDRVGPPRTGAVDVARAARSPRRTPAEVDALRARALLGDPLGELGDGEREWVWRSLLKGARLGEACALAELE